MRQKDWGQVDLYVLACSLHGASSHGSPLSDPGWPQTSRVREGCYSGCHVEASSGSQMNDRIIGTLGDSCALR
jgi:hypothetical protein